MFRILLVVFAFFSITATYAQSSPAPLQLQFGMMGFTYEGDLTDFSTSFNRFYPGGSIGLQFDGKSFLQPSLQAGYGTFTEQANNLRFPDNPEIDPTHFVHTSFFFTDLQMRFRLFPKRNFQPYVSAGIGLFFFTPKDEDDNFLGENTFTRLEGEDYLTTVQSFPFSIGFMNKLSPIVGIGLDYSYRPTGSDYLDNVGKLGTRSGKDQLHSLRFSVYLSLVPNDADKIMPEPPTENPAALAKIAQAKEAKKLKKEEAAKAKLAKKEAAKEESAKEKVVKVQPIESVTPKTSDEINVSPSETTAQSEIDWLAIEKLALANRDFVYYRISGETLQGLADRFHIRIETLRRINHKVNDDLAAESYLRMPNMGIDF